MDDDPVLRSLAEELERDDPELAALLGELPRRQRHTGAWLVLGVLVLGVVLLLPAGMAFGILAMLAVVCSPLLVCWLIASDDGPVPGRP